MPNTFALYLTKIYYIYFLMGLLWVIILKQKIPSLVLELSCVGYFLLFPLYSRCNVSVTIQKLSDLTKIAALQDIYLHALGLFGILIVVSSVVKYENKLSPIIQNIISVCSKKSLDIYALQFYFLGYLSGILNGVFTILACLVTSEILRQSNLLKLFLFGDKSVSITSS